MQCDINLVKCQSTLIAVLLPDTHHVLLLVVPFKLHFSTMQQQRLSSGLTWPVRLKPVLKRQNTAPMTWKMSMTNVGQGDGRWWGLGKYTKGSRWIISQFISGTWSTRGRTWMASLEETDSPQAEVSQEPNNRVFMRDRGRQKGPLSFHSFSRDSLMTRSL